MTGPELLAIASGKHEPGSHGCVLCGAACGERYTTAEYLKDSFTARDTLRAPSSPFVCAGCVLAFHEVGTANYPYAAGDGGARTREWTKAFFRGHSWIITSRVAIPATISHQAFLAASCLCPGDVPYCICLTSSGQKHLLYLAAVGHSRETIVANLDGERIEYRPRSLNDRLVLCGQLVAATGKPALVELPSSSFWFRVCERYQRGESLCSQWVAVREEPLSHLAAFLTPRKELCDAEYPGDRPDRVSPESGGAHRPEPKANGRGRNRKHQGRVGPTLPDTV